jgi:sortase A
MKKNTIITYLIGLITAAAMFFFFYTLSGALWGRTELVDAGLYAPAISKTESVSVSFATPSKLRIPSIDVDAKVQQVGLTKTGAMGIPTNFTDVAWYKHGPIPGEVGSAVIDGHVDNGLGLKGVFKNLKNLEAGDTIYVDDKNGTTSAFIVIDVKEYPYKEAPAEEIFYEPERRLLRLITCGGKWIRSAQTYETRVVVTAEYVP